MTGELWYKDNRCQPDGGSYFTGEMMTGKKDGDQKREREESADAATRLGELLGASESGPAGQEVENRPGRSLAEILQGLGLTP